MDVIDRESVDVWIDHGWRSPPSTDGGGDLKDTSGKGNGQAVRFDGKMRDK